MNLLASRHLDLPVALGLVGVVLRVVGSLNGNLWIKHEDNEMVADKIFFSNLLSISKGVLSVLAAEGFHLVLGEESFLWVPCVCSLKTTFSLSDFDVRLLLQQQRGR